MRLIPILFVLSVVLNARAQETDYVSDRVEIPLRAGTSTEYKILRMLPGGTPVTVLGEASDSGYTRVRTDSDVEGFVLSRYLMDRPPARLQLAQNQSELTQLDTENERLKQQLARLDAEQQRLQQSHRQLEIANRRLSEQLAQIRKTAADAIAIDERNKRLEQKTIELERSLQLVQQENQALRDSSNQDWFVRGAGVLLAGLLVGAILPRLRPRRSARWGEL